VNGIDAAAIAAQVDSAVVDITTTSADGGGAAGTGMILTSSGEVLTNNHVIEGATSIRAQVSGTGRTYTGTVVGYDVTDDVALVKLDNASGLKTVTTGNSSALKVGSPIVAIGNALGRGGTPAATSGNITALDQTITAGGPGAASETLHGLVQIDATIQSGDSGGPLVDASGRVIGMTTAALSTGRGFLGGDTSNEAYAIPINAALQIVQQIRTGKSSATIQIGARAFLGVSVTDANSGLPGGFGGRFGGSSASTAPVSSGALVLGVQDGSPAQTAGLAAGDAIVSVNGTAISSSAGLTSALQTHHPGDTITLGWVDPAGNSHTASVTLSSGPPA
jgi:S1-C subfamily serine protease